MTTLASSANGATWVASESSQLVTLSTTGDRTFIADFLPANSVIRGVALRVVEAIGVIDPPVVQVGDEATANRFAESAHGNFWGAGDTLVGQRQIGTTACIQDASAALYITVSQTDFPSGGQVRVTLFYDQITAPTS